MLEQKKSRASDSRSDREEKILRKVSLGSSLSRAAARSVRVSSFYFSNLLEVSCFPPKDERDMPKEHLLSAGAPERNFERIAAPSSPFFFSFFFSRDSR